MLNFDLDTDQMKSIADEFEASEKDLRLAFSRAARRTAGTLRKLSRQRLRTELELRTMSVLRKRLRDTKLRGNSRSMGGIRLWFGANDMPIRAFKGRPRKTAGGASFKGNDYDGGFVGKHQSGKRTIFRRVGDGRLPIAEQTVPVADEMQTVLEDQVFDQLDDIFMRHFRSEVKARTVYKVGR